MTAPNRPPIVRRWPHLVGLGATGLLSFVLAAAFQMWMMTAKDDEKGIAAPGARAASGSAAPVRPPLKELQYASVTAPQQADMVRMDDHVILNPFGALNLMAGLDLDKKPATPGDPRELTPGKKRQAKITSPAPPPQVAAVPLAPPPPTAPPIPFIAVGAIHGAQIAEGKPVAFLRQGDNVLAVRAGDSIGPSYHVDNISPEKIEFTYLPLKQRQFLPLAR